MSVHLIATPQTLMRMSRRSQLPSLLVLREVAVPQMPAVLESRPRRMTRKQSPLRRLQLLRAMIQIQMIPHLVLMLRFSLRVRPSLPRKLQLQSQRKQLRLAQTLTLMTAARKTSPS